MTIQERVKHFIVENFYVADASTIEPGTSLISTGLVDSTGMLELISFLEEEFDIRIQDREMTPDNLETLARIDAYVTRKQPG